MTRFAATLSPFRQGPPESGARGSRIRFLAVLAVTTCLFFSAALAAPGNALDDALRQFDLGHYQQAATILSSALAQNASEAGSPAAAASQTAMLHYWLGRCYFELRHFDGAISSAERSVALEPNNSVYHQWLGRAYGSKAEHASWFSALSLAKKARREFEEAVRLDASNVEAQQDLIEFYRQAPGMVGGGEEKWGHQVEALATVDSGEAHLARGMYFAEKKKPEKAEEEFRQVLEAKPKRADAYFEVADFYARRNNAARMEEAVEAAARVTSSDRRLGYYRGVVRILAGSHPAEAERLLKGYIDGVPERSDFPSHASALEWLGRFYEAQGKRDAAAEQYRAALALEPHNKGARAALRQLDKK